MNIFDEIKAKTNCFELVKDLGLDLKGQKIQCPSPNHTDHDPSCQVNNDYYYCHGCHTYFSCIDLVMHVKGLDLLSASQYLADKAGIPWPVNGKEQAKEWGERQALYLLYTETAKLYNKELDNTHLKLLQKKWGLTAETANKYLFGFAPGGRFISEKLLESGFTDEFVLKSGLVNKGGYDVFNRRLVFPYWKSGQVVYFIARRIEGVTPDNEYEKAKFKKLPVYDERSRPYISKAVSNEFFAGEDTACGAGELIVTEGIADCYSALQLGLSCISPVTVTFRKADWSKLTRLSKGTETVYICNDNEENSSGKDGALKTAEHLTRQGINVRLIELPRPEGVEKVDLADFLRDNGAEAFRELMKQARPGYSFPGVITARDLVKEVFPEPEWIIPGLLPKGGVGILAGAPKFGKSWMCLGMGLEIAAGGYAFGKIPVQQGSILYLALEDTERRLQSRLKMMGGKAPERFFLTTKWPRLGDGGTELLEEWLKTRPDCRLIIVDTLQRMRPPEDGNRGLYSQDYETLCSFKSIADEHDVSILVVHHLRKMMSEDPLMEVSGTTGLTGAADTIWILKKERARADAVLFTTGRDINETETAMRFDKNTGLWTILGDADEYRTTKERHEIIKVLRESGEAMRPKEIADILGKNSGSVRNLLAKLVKGNYIKSIGYGLYISSDTDDSNDGSDTSDSGDTCQVSPSVTGRNIPPVTLFKEEGQLDKRGSGSVTTVTTDREAFTI